MFGLRKKKEKSHRDEDEVLAHILRYHGFVWADLFTRGP